MVLETTADEVVSTFMVTPKAERLFRQWRGNPRQRHVSDFVMGHTASVLYSLRPEDVQAVAARSDHPLGDIRKADADSVRAVVDWRPDFAFAHVFHYVLEATGGMYTFQDFRDFCMSDDQARAMLTDHAQEIVKMACGDRYGDRAARTLARNAVQWRVGNAYYSFLREAYTIAVLRAAGLDVHAHPLADALFRVDSWIGRTIVSIYIRNSKFRDGSVGRKSPVESILRGADPAFTFAELRLDVQHAFGRVHMPADEQIRRLGYTVIRGPGLNQVSQTTPIETYSATERDRSSR